MTFLPIVDRELSVAARRASTYWLRFWAALAMLGIWLLLLVGKNGAPGQIGHVLLTGLGILALAFSMFAGAFLTADSLAEEKREGTLGLLFLTDLKGYDVVLGKLVACSLNSFFGLLATFPILGLTLLLGGVTGREFFRLMLVFAATLIFSLGIGLFVSAVSREARQAMGRSFLLIVIFAGICPMLWWGQHLRFRILSPILLLPSPAFTYRMAFDAYYRSFVGAHDFWLSLGTVFGIGITGILLAAMLLPGAWRKQDSIPAIKAKSRWWKPGTHQGTFARRAAVLTTHPYYWLATRIGKSGRQAVMALVLFAPIWFGFLIASYFSKAIPPVAFIICLFAAFGLHLLVKLMIATEASRRFNEDRHNGALELLLATPISVRVILSGQMQALAYSFVLPLLILGSLNVVLGATVIFNGRGLQIPGDDLTTFLELFIGGLLTLVADFYALCWVGMWRGLKTGKHARAVVGTVGRVMFLPWLVIFLLMILQPNINGAHAADLIFGTWFAFGLVISLTLGTIAKFRVRARFRELAARTLPAKA
jgi:ABC-type transport system involved in multi-copper enzyme maturation permease subunit